VRFRRYRCADMAETGTAENRILAPKRCLGRTRPLSMPRRLIDFLVDVTEAAERTPELDIFHTGDYRPWRVLWIEEIPDDAGIVDLVSDPNPRVGR
jgi:hypothetical protein